MKKTVLLIGAFYGLFSVILGAFGAHALKKILPEASLQSFETGVKYQMYHAIVLLILGFSFSFVTKFEAYTAWFFIVGTLLFSVSIYFLAMSKVWNTPMNWLGPVTPLGGLLLIIGWTMLIINIYRKF